MKRELVRDAAALSGGQASKGSEGVEDMLSVAEAQRKNENDAEV